MRAWDKLTDGSTLSSGSAWMHLNAQGGEGRRVVYVETVAASFADYELMGSMSAGAFGATVGVESLSANIANVTIAAHSVDHGIDGATVDLVLGGNVL